jgi:hypothetical protein
MPCITQEDELFVPARFQKGIQLKVQCDWLAAWPRIATVLHKMRVKNVFPNIFR